MKIAVPIRDNRFCSHFGGADAFAFFTVGEGRQVVGEPQILSPPEHGRGVFPMWLRKQGATMVLAGGMGERAAGILAGKGIAVMLGVTGEDPNTMIEEFLEGTLENKGDPCREHGLHGCGDHGGGHGKGHGRAQG